MHTAFYPAIHATGAGAFMRVINRVYARPYYSAGYVFDHAIFRDRASGPRHACNRVARRLRNRRVYAAPLARIR